MAGGSPSTRVWVAMVVVLVVTVGGLLALRGSSPDVAGPSIAPSSNSQSPSVSAAVGAAPPAPAALRGSWIADGAPIPDLAAPGPTIGITIDGPGTGSWVRASDDVLSVLRSTTSASATDILTLVLDRAGSGCAAGDPGHARWSLSADGSELTLTSVDDACAVRATALSRTWVRSHMNGSVGGRGVVDIFDPAFVVTLPGDSWQATPHTDVIELASGPLAVFVGKDPQGFAEPCRSGGGAHVNIAPGLDPFEAYVRGLPGFSVEATDEVIGGYPARHLGITSTVTPPCVKDQPIIEWRAKAETTTLNWILGAGGADSMDVVALPNATILFQLIPQGNGAVVDYRAVLDSIQFLDHISDAASGAP